jgi:hypothetical protein
MLLTVNIGVTVRVGDAIFVVRRGDGFSRMLSETSLRRHREDIEGQCNTEFTVVPSGEHAPSE